MHIVHLFEKHLNHCKRCKPAEALPVLARFRMSTTVQAESKRTCSFCRGAARSRTLSRARIQKIQQTPSINDIKNVVKFGFAPFLPQNTCCKGTTISLVVHLAHSEEMHTAVAYGSYGMDKLLNGEPAVAKSICGTESMPPLSMSTVSFFLLSIHVKVAKQNCATKVMIKWENDKTSSSFFTYGRRILPMFSI